MNKGHSPLVQFFLVMVLVLDYARVYEIAHARACIPSHVVRIYIDLSQVLDHLILICYVGFRSWSGGSDILKAVTVCFWI